MSLIRSHARRLNRLYVLDGSDVWGISVFVALDDVGPASFDALLRDRLKGYPTVYVPTVDKLVDAGFVLLGTFGRPHFTLLLGGEDDVERLVGRLGELRVNPYAVT